MLSKFLRTTATRWSSVILIRRVVPLAPQAIPVRVMSHWIPPNQYDMPWPKRLSFFYVIREYWETIPLFVTTAVSITILILAIVWACNHKVDVVFTTHSRANISRTMDLNNPSVNKIIIINQRYPPWPEMQDVLDKMKVAEKRALVRAQTCPAT